MDADLKKTLKAVTLELRHLLEGRYDQGGQWKPGDLEQRLAAIGVRRDRSSVPVDELGHLADEDRQARKVVDAYLKLRDEAGVERSEAVAEFVRETAYTWANRLLALRCMEARELIDSVILQQEAYAGRSLEHHRLAQRHPELCAGDDDGLFAVLDKVFRAQAGRLPMLFDPQAPGIALRPSASALKHCFGLLSLNPDTLRKVRIRLTEDETASSGVKPPNPFTAPDALGWAYQYWNTEEKNRVFETVRTVKGAKIAGADIIPATQLYTEDYMVKFLVQNSLGATWMGMHPESRLAENWEYYVKDADRAPVEKKPVCEITFLDPACGSGHFHLEAFDLFYAMYQEEGELTAPEEICNAILTKNLFGIDIDPRAVQIAEVALWMKAAERAFDYKGVPTNLVAATSSHLKGEAWEEFIAGFEREPSVARVLRSFARTMEHIDEIGSLARPAEDLREIIKEEHATWERQVSEKKEANFLFPEMNEAAVSGQVPFQEISDEEFGDRLFYRAKAGIDAFTERARASGEFEDQMLGSETRAGFRLVDLLSQRYDVVAANPPYLGSSNMGQVIKAYTEREFEFGRRDLFSAFMVRSLMLAGPQCRFAAVVPQSWLFLSGFEELRAGNRKNAGLLQSATLEILVQLGRHAFAEIDPATNPSLVVMANVPAMPSHHITCFRVDRPTPANRQAELLRTGMKLDGSTGRYRPRQTVFCGLPGAPICFWANLQMLNRMEHSSKIADIADVPAGLTTGNGERFLRFHWEVANPTNWMRLAHGGPFRRWVGNETSVLRWANGWREVIRCFGNQLPNESLYQKLGISVSQGAIGILGFRIMENSAFTNSAMAVVPHKESDVYFLLGYLNTRITSFFVRLFSKKFGFEATHLASVPAEITAGCSDDVVDSVKCILALVACKASRDPREWRCDGRLRSIALVSRHVESTLQHALEAHIERMLRSAMAWDAETCELVDAETEPHTGNFATVSGYTTLPSVPSLTSKVRESLASAIAALPTVHLGSEDLDSVKKRIREFASQRTADEPPDDFGESADTEQNERNRLTHDPETVIEDLCRQVGLHPVSVFHLIQVIENEGVSIIDRERTENVKNSGTILVLRLLGHRWPKQVEASEPVPDWADPDGIIPITPLAKETTLFDRMQRRLRADEIDASAFDEVMSKPLDAWLATEFFKHHTKQFKKRPIAWQLQSDKFTARKPPAFACLLYYHKLDADTLPKLQSQYLGPLRQRLETELRGILAVAADARSDRQEKRRGELDEGILELQKFDSVLETVARTGFGPQSLFPTLRQNAIDDATLALKARWLRRLSELIAKSPLPDWLAAADRTELHPDFRVWIADAMAHLDQFCARVGPKAPDQAKLTSDPIAADLAKLITPQAKEMLKDTLELACDKWYAQFEEIVLGPDKDEIKKLREEQKSCEEQLEGDPAPSAVEVRDLKYRVKEIKEDVKVLTAKIKRRAALANKVRTLIEGWQNKEPAGWGDWLAEQPLFDRTSSLDGRRADPTTIAEFVVQESLYAPDINDGVRVNIAPLQKAGVLAADVLAGKDLDKAIADRAEWRADERRWVREGKLPQPGWWSEQNG